MVGLRTMEPWRVGSQNFAFFPLSCHNFSSLGGSSRGMLVMFEASEPSDVRVWSSLVAVWSSNGHIWGSRPLKTPPKFNERTPKRESKRTKMKWKREKRAKFWAVRRRVVQRKGVQRRGVQRRQGVRSRGEPEGPTNHSNNHQHPTPNTQQHVKNGLAKIGLAQIGLSKIGLAKVGHNHTKCVGCDIVQADHAPEAGVAQGIFHGILVRHQT